MKASELYAMQPQEDTLDVSLLRGCHYDHIPELGNIHLEEVTKNNKLVVMRIIKEYNFDYRRFWRLATV